MDGSSTELLGSRYCIVLGTIFFQCLFYFFGFAKVERRAVDRFSDGDVFVSCVVRAEWARDSPPQPLFCELKFRGAAEGFDFITIQSPQGIQIRIKV